MTKTPKTQKKTLPSKSSKTPSKKVTPKSTPKAPRPRRTQAQQFGAIQVIFHGPVDPVTPSEPSVDLETAPRQAVPLSSLITRPDVTEVNEDTQTAPSVSPAAPSTPSSTPSSTPVPPSTGSCRWWQEKGTWYAEAPSGVVRRYSTEADARYQVIQCSQVRRVSAATQPSLSAGMVFRIPGDQTGRIYVVDYVNASRAHCLPFAGGTTRTIESADGVHQFEDRGGSINIAPTACVEVVDPSTLNPDIQEKLMAKKAGKNTRSSKTAGNGSTRTRTARPKAEAKLSPCKCGCGGETKSAFVQGHDARFKGLMLKVERGQMTKAEALPKVYRQYEWVPTKAGGERTTTNYKGEPHKGYDRANA